MSSSTLTKGKVAVYVILTKLRSCRWTRARSAWTLSDVWLPVSRGKWVAANASLCTCLWRLRAHRSLNVFSCFFFIAHHQSFNVGRLRLKQNTLASPCPRVKSATEFIALHIAAESVCSHLLPCPSLIWFKMTTLSLLTFMPHWHRSTGWRGVLTAGWSLSVFVSTWSSVAVFSSSLSLLTLSHASCLLSYPGIFTFPSLQNMHRFMTTLYIYLSAWWRLPSPGRCVALAPGWVSAVM